MTAISDLPRIPTGELRLTFRFDETTAALAISPALGHDPIRAGAGRLGNGRPPDQPRPPRRPARR
jgi:hypothetical protein